METERFIDGRCDVIKSVQSGHGINRRTNGSPYMSVSSRPINEGKKNQSLTTAIRRAFQIRCIGQADSECFWGAVPLTSKIDLDTNLGIDLNGSDLNKSDLSRKGATVYHMLDGRQDEAVTKLVFEAR